MLKLWKVPKLVLHNDNLPLVKSENDQSNRLQHNSALRIIILLFLLSGPKIGFSPHRGDTLGR